MKKNILVLISALSFLVAHAQSVIEVKLKDRCEESTLIIEGKVLDSQCSWDKNKQMIYTIYQLETYTILKGKSSVNKISLLVEGGQAGEDMMEVSHTLKLKNGEFGVFMLKPKNIDFESTDLNASDYYQVVAAEQGFIKYSKDLNTAHDLFSSYSNIKKEVLNPISNVAKQKPVSVKKNDARLPKKNLTNFSIERSTEGIISFSPDSITSGTQSILTITGSGFGSNIGTVEFKDADNGGSSYVSASTITSWADTEIKLKVPTDAGSGTIKVTTSTSTVFTSASQLGVKYAVLNTSGGLPIYLYGFSDGGYTWTFNSEFNSNSSAKAAFLRAFTTIRCATFVNWEISAGTTNVSSASNDDIFVISFDNASDDLPSGLLGRCSRTFSSCNSTDWYVTELDIRFRRESNTSWNYTTSTPLPSSYDFESVAMHELGHGLGLGHVINSNDPMHYSISSGSVKKTLNTYNKQCANSIISASSNNSFCTKPKHNYYSGTACSNADNNPPTLSSFSPLNNATGVSVVNDIKITFNKDVVIGSIGNITIKSGSTNFVTIPVGDTSISINGKVLSINPKNDFAFLTSYNVLIDSGAIIDFNSKAYVGLKASTDWAFTTESSDSGIDDNNANKNLKIIPHPNNGQFNLILRNLQLPVNVNVFNSAGLLQKNFLVNTMQNAFNLDLPSGVYLINALDNEGKNYARKLIINK